MASLHTACCCTHLTLLLGGGFRCVNMLGCDFYVNVWQMLQKLCVNRAYLNDVEDLFDCPMYDTILLVHQPCTVYPANGEGFTRALAVIEIISVQHVY